MPTTLLVTNDFPPTLGGIQSYLRDYLATLDPAEVLVLTSTQDAVAAREYDALVDYEVIRCPTKILLPTPAITRRMQEIIKTHQVDTVWFGAAAPLGLMGKAARAAGASRIIATTHGHEVGWSMLPGARHALRRIGNQADVVTYISEYTRRRFARAFGPHPRFMHLPSGVDTVLFSPATVKQRAQTRREFSLSEAPVVLCISRLVPRKGQDQLIRAWPHVCAQLPGAQLLLVGQGSYRRRLEALIHKHQVDKSVRLLGALDFPRLRALLAAADVFAMPARTRGKGLDVEGLGIVYLEAQSCALPVIAGDSGGAPETITPASGIVVDGHDLPALEGALLKLLQDPEKARAMGKAGRTHVEDQWTWEKMGARLRDILRT